MRQKTRCNKAEAGVALLIALFALLLICVVGMALIMASGTDTALTGNYSSATSVYYAALAGLEEARSRLLPKSPNNLAAAEGAAPGTLPTIVGTTVQVWYITNPLPGENVTPWDTSSSSEYPDNEFAQEFPATTPNTQAAPSIALLPVAGHGPLYTMYKWVRINAITANSVFSSTNITVGGLGPANTPLLYANGNLYTDPVAAGPQAVQALEITALAAMQMPNGTLSQRMLQYVVAPINFGLTLPAALMLDGSNVAFQGPPSTQFLMSGTDSASPLLPGCLPGATLQAAIGYTNAGDNSLTNIQGGIPVANRPNYTGVGGVLPNVIGTSGPTQIVIPPNLQTVASLNNLVQTITANADFSFSGNQNSSILPAMAAANPMTVVVNGNLDLTGWTGPGYGVLLVTGTLTYDPNASWMGVVLVIGQGQVISATGNGSGQINGAVLVAQTAPPFSSSWLQPSSGSLGINYSSCWINAVQPTISFKVLSFREIPLPTS